MAAFLFLADRRQDRARHAELNVAVLAQSGDEKSLKKQFETWEREA